MRLSHKQLEGIKSKFGVDRLWSYSRVSTFLEHPWEYRIVYLDKLTRSSNVYTYFGTICHDIIQEYYEGKHSYEQMETLFDQAILEWRTGDTGYRFMNEKIEAGYVDNLADYFKNTEVVPYKVVNERPICVQLYDEKRKKNVVFTGYLDSEYVDEDGIFNIVDYKSSSKSGFSGKQLKEKSKQLMLYAIGVNQFRGIPFEKIRLRFDMMKYYEIFFLQKNGKWKGSKQERAKWVATQEKKIRTVLLDNGFDAFEIDEMVEVAIVANKLDSLPDCVKDRFELKNCYIDVTITEEEAEELKEFMLDTIARCEELEASDDWDKAFPEPVIDQSNEFYYTQLSPQVLKFNKKYQEDKKLYVSGQELDNDELEDLFK